MEAAAYDLIILGFHDISLHNVNLLNGNSTLHMTLTFIWPEDHLQMLFKLLLPDEILRLILITSHSL